MAIGEEGIGGGPAEAIGRARDKDACHHPILTPQVLRCPQQPFPDRASLSGALFRAARPWCGAPQSRHFRQFPDGVETTFNACLIFTIREFIDQRIYGDNSPIATGIR